MKYFAGLVFSVLLFGTSCGKDSNGDSTIAPTNLTLNATVSTDNSGNVDFTASATNAKTYDYDFGNGIFQTVPAGIVTYKYPSSGTYTVNVIAKSAGGQTVSKSVTITVNVSTSMVWSDEFNTPGAPDPAKWGYNIGTGDAGWGNNELQYYTNRSENVSISNGTLKITAKREAYSGSTFTSARLLTQNKYSFKYGKVEVRAKLPAGVGTWPAVWMLGSNINTAGWPACGEIDNMEHVGKEHNKIYGTLHHPGHSGGNADSKTVMLPTATTDFNIYTTEWTANSIIFSVNNVPFYTFANKASLPFNHEYFIILNVAIGGNFGGPVAADVNSATMEIDYIRVYK